MQEEQIVIDSWKREAILGSGAFGVITLWRHLHSNERIALKQCKWAVTGSRTDKDCDAVNAITPKHKERWKQEVQIMHKLNHPNVVKATEVPAALETGCVDLPSLGMEYCSGGDLRQVLNKPENVCGLHETSVRNILSQIASAVLYLHSNRIIHRDLKPENIVIQPQPNGELVYKLIDLGYCKQLDQSSLCNSFVGTLQYLAPELFISKNYTSVVDNWSFGLLTHEIITGKRPFLPHLSPTQWIPIVSRKKSEDICAIHEIKTGKITFSKEISSFNQISKSLKERLEVWLREMVEFDPNKRQKGSFLQLGRILEKLTIRVFIINTLEFFTYEISRETQLSELKILIDSNAKISPKDQMLMIPSLDKSNGKLFIGDEDSTLKCLYDKMLDAKKIEVTLYLLDRSKTLVYSPYSTTCVIPSSVEEILLEPTKLITFEEQKCSWKHFIWSSQKIIEQYCSLAQIRDLMTDYNSYLVDSVLQQYNACNIRCNQLTAISDFFREKIKYDLSMLTNNSSNRFSSINNLLSICEEVIVSLKGQHLLDYKLKGFSQKLTRLFAGRKELLNCGTKNFDYNPLEPNNFPDKCDKESMQIVDVYLKMLQIFDKMRRTTKEERNEKIKSVKSEAAFDNTSMVKLLCDLFQIVEKLIKQLYNDITKLVQFIDDCNKLNKDISSVSKYLLEIQKLKELQLKYQTCLWNIFTENGVDSNSRMNCDKDDLSNKDIDAKLTEICSLFESNVTLLSLSNDSPQTECSETFTSESSLQSEWTFLP